MHFTTRYLFALALFTAVSTAQAGLFADIIKRIQARGFVSFQKYEKISQPDLKKFEEWTRTQIQELGFKDTHFDLGVYEKFGAGAATKQSLLGRNSKIAFGQEFIETTVSTIKSLEKRQASLENKTNLSRDESRIIEIADAMLRAKRMIIAHELGHENRSSTKRMVPIYMTGLITALVSACALPTGTEVIAPTLLFMTRFACRHEERLADAFACSKARDTKDLKAFADYFRQHSGDYPFQLLSTHPLNSERIENINSYAKEKFGRLV